MRVRMLKTCGSFKAGGVYEVSKEIAKLFFTRGQAVLVLDESMDIPNKSMVPAQVRKGGLA